MLTGTFDPHPRGSDWIWAHDIIADDTSDLMNLDGCVFTLNVSRSNACGFRDYGWGAGSFYALDNAIPADVIASLSTGIGVLTAEKGTIVATVPGAATLDWSRGDNRVTLDVTRYGETVRLVDMILPVTGP